MEKRISDTVKRLRKRLARFRGGRRDPWDDEQKTVIDPDVAILVKKLKQKKRNS